MIDHATSNNISGYFSATLSRVLAAPDGCLRPCSQSCNVRTDTPNNLANSDCDSPRDLRATMAGECTITPCPAAISFAAANSFSPSSLPVIKSLFMFKCGQFDYGVHNRNYTVKPYRVNQFTVG